MEYLIDLYLKNNTYFEWYIIFNSLIYAFIKIKEF